MSTAFSRSWNPCIQCSTDLLTVLQPLLLLHTQEISSFPNGGSCRRIARIECCRKRKQKIDSSLYVHKNSKKNTTAQYPRNVFAFFQDLLHCHCKIFTKKGFLHKNEYVRKCIWLCFGYVIEFLMLIREMAFVFHKK